MHCMMDFQQPRTQVFPHSFFSQPLKILCVFCDDVWMVNMMYASSLQISDALLFEGDEEAKEERELVEVNEQV